MTTVNTVIPSRPYKRQWNQWVALSAAWETYRCVRQQQKAIRNMAKLPPRLIRDIGFDPEMVYDTANIARHDPESLKLHCAGLWR